MVGIIGRSNPREDGNIMSDNYKRDTGAETSILIVIQFIRHEAELAITQLFIYKICVCRLKDKMTAAMSSCLFAKILLSLPQVFTSATLDLPFRPVACSQRYLS